MTLELYWMFITKKWHAKFQLNTSKHKGEKWGKLWLTDGDPDGRTDGHYHTIIRPVWRRAYKNYIVMLIFMHWNHCRSHRPALQLLSSLPASSDKMFLASASNSSLEICKYEKGIKLCFVDALPYSWQYLSQIRMPTRKTPLCHFTCSDVICLQRYES